MTQKDPFRVIIDASREVEAILEDKFGAEGQGLASKARALSDVLGTSVVEEVVFLAEIRAKVELYDTADPAKLPLDRFDRAYQDVIRALDATDPVRGVEQKRTRRRALKSTAREALPGAHVHRPRIGLLIGLGVVVLALAFALSRRSSGRRSATAPAPFGTATVR